MSAGDRIAAHLAGVALRKAQAVAMYALGSLVMKTPVDKGQARGGWTAGIESPVPSPDREDPTGQTAIAEGQAVIAGAKFGEKIVLSNNVPYIGPLNDGHSKQAPNGMVEGTMAEIQSLGGKV